jgi:hypothetical protein
MQVLVLQFEFSRSQDQQQDRFVFPNEKQFVADASQIGAASILAWWTSWRRRWNGDKRKGADSLFALVAWEIWKERKARCFRNSSATVPQLLVICRNHANVWIDAGKLDCLVRE